MSARGRSGCLCWRASGNTRRSSVPFCHAPRPCPHEHRSTSFFSSILFAASGDHPWVNATWYINILLFLHHRFNHWYHNILITLQQFRLTFPLTLSFLSFVLVFPLLHHRLPFATRSSRPEMISFLSLELNSMGDVEHSDS